MKERKEMTRNYAMKEERKNSIPHQLRRRGIYLIVNHANGKVYVGSTHVNFYDRWKHHTENLRNQKHNNVYLQHAWNKYGEAMFEFMVLEEIEDESKIIQAEQFYLDIFYGTNSYNIHPIAKSPVGKITRSALRKYLYVFDPAGNKHGPITNIAHFARTVIGVSTIRLNSLLNGRQNNLDGWTRAYDLTDFEKRIISKHKEQINLKRIARRSEGRLKNVGRPKTPQPDITKVILEKIYDPCISLRKLATKTGVKFLTVRRILIDNDLDNISEFNCSEPLSRIKSPRIKNTR